MANIYGTLVKAQLESLAADIGTPPTGLVYLNSVSGFARFYDGAAWRNLVTETNTQTLTNKTLTTPVLDDYTDINEEAAPGSPAAGKVRMYAKADGKIYKKTSAGVESELGGTGAPVATATVTGTVTSYVPVVQSSVYASGDAAYTILDGDGYAVVTVAPVATERVILLPLAANNIGRTITVTNVGALTTSSSSYVGRQGADVIYTGASRAATTVPLNKVNATHTLTAIAAGVWATRSAATDPVATFGTSGNFSTFQAYVWKIGNMIHITVDYATWPSNQQPRTTSSASIPVGLRVPAITVIGTNGLYNDYNSGNLSSTLLALPDGNLEIRLNSATTGIAWPITGSYMLRY